MKLAPQGHYNLNGGSVVGNPVHDLNTIDSRNPDIDGITDTDRDAHTGDELDNDDDSTSAGVCHFSNPWSPSSQIYKSYLISGFEVP